MKLFMTLRHVFVYSGSWNYWVNGSDDEMKDKIDRRTRVSMNLWRLARKYRRKARDEDKRDKRQKMQSEFSRKELAGSRSSWTRRNEQFCLSILLNEKLHQIIESGKFCSGRLRRTKLSTYEYTNWENNLLNCWRNDWNWDLMHRACRSGSGLDVIGRFLIKGSPQLYIAGRQSHERWKRGRETRRFVTKFHTRCQILAHIMRGVSGTVLTEPGNVYTST